MDAWEEYIDPDIWNNALKITPKEVGKDFMKGMKMKIFHGMRFHLKYLQSGLKRKKAKAIN